MKIKKSVLISIIIVSALVIGAGTGVLIKRFSNPKVNYTGFNPDSAKYKADELIKEVETYNTIEERVKNFTPTQISQYSLEKYKKCENCVSFCIGEGKAAGVHLDIRNAQIKVGKQYFEETITKSTILSFSRRTYQETNYSEVKLFSEKSSKDITITSDLVHTNFNNVPEKLTQSEFVKIIGRTLPDMFGYLVHDSTIINESIDKTVEGYVVNIEANPVKATFNYRNQIKNFAGLEEFPIYYSTTFSYVLDKNLQLKESHIIEKYKANVISIHFDVTNKLDNYFLPNFKAEIPQITENFDYKAFSELAK